MNDGFIFGGIVVVSYSVPGMGRKGVGKSINKIMNPRGKGMQA
jgi:hypothetical protein